MKSIKLLYIGLLLTLIFPQILFSQAPEGVNYQAVVRDALGEPLSSKSAVVRFTIRQGSATGASVFQETHSTTTNQFGLVNLKIGSINTSDFPTINWGVGGAHYLQVEVNVGSGFINLGATQLLSVPYALHAKTAATGVAGADGHSSLSTTTVEPLGVNCPNGGTKVDFGVDNNDNGVLEGGEIVGVYYVCNGLDGSSSSGLTAGAGIDITTGVVKNIGDLSDTNEIQAFSRAGNVVTLSKGGGTFTDAVNDADSDITNELVTNFGLNGASDSLIIQEGSNKKGVPLSSLGSGNSSAWTSNGTSTTLNSLTENVGIGTTTPVKKLHIETASISGGDGIVINANSTNGDPGLMFQTQGISQFVLGVDQSDNNKFKIGTTNVNTNPRFTIDNQGKVGVGTNSPTAKLDVVGTAEIDSLRINNSYGLPTSDGAANEILTTDGSGGVSWKTPISVSGAWTSSGTATILNSLNDNVGIGTTAPNAKLYIQDTSSINNPTLQLHEASTSFSRIKHTNAIANKYWLTEAGINANDANSGYSISYNNGVSSKIPFIVYGDDKVGVNNLAAPLGSFHVMDMNASGNGVISEGFNQPGLIVVSRNNFSSPNRGGINNGEEIGRLLFPGYASASYGDGPRIFANATEKFTSTANGSELVFGTIANGTTSYREVLKLLNDGRVEIINNLLIPTGAAANKVLTSDASGNATWQTPTTANSFWTQESGILYPTTLTDKVGVGIGDPQVNLHVAENGEATIAVQSSSNLLDGGRVSLIKTRGTTTIPSGVLSGDRLGKLEFVGFDNTFNYTEAASIRASADEDFGSTNHGAHLEFHTSAIGGGGGEAMRITDRGDIGIGTTTPSAKLDVEGNFQLKDGTEGANKVLTSDASGNATWKNPTIATSFWTQGSGTLYPTTLTDKVGIGTTAPNSSLHIKDSNTNANISQLTIEANNSFGSQSYSGLEFRSNYTGSNTNISGRIKSYYKTGGFTDATMTFQTVTSGPAYVDVMSLTDGKVGIGTTAPNTSLDVTEDLSIRESLKPLSITAISNMSGTTGKSFINFNSAPGNFTIFGIANGVDGKILRLYNSTIFNMTLVNESSNTANNRILTMSGGNISTIGTGVITIQYSANEQRWIVVSIVQ